MPKILNYIILSSLFIFLSVGNAFAQQKDTTTVRKKPIEQKKDSLPLIRTITVEIDVASLLEKALSNGVSYGAKGNIQLNLKNRLFPVVELGYSGADKTLLNNSTFSGKGLFEKIGVDFSLVKQKPGGKFYNSFFLAGLRLGFSHFNYEINNMTIKDGYWGGSEVLNDKGAANKFWFEMVGGVRVPIYKKIIMGWNVQNKRLLGSVESGKLTPWYIPGYGKNLSSLWGFSYVVGYQF